MISKTPGYSTFHQDIFLNSMLNRMAWLTPTEELDVVARRIKTFDDFVPEILKEAELAERKGRLKEASAYLRGAEFFMDTSTQQKTEVYNRFVELHDMAFPEIVDYRNKIPYQSGMLPVVDIPAKSEERGVILAHTGYDGLIEEMYLTIPALAEAGYRIILFDGPGQGAALRRYGLHMIPEWEQPVAAVLDYYNIKECTLIGFSLGGYLAARAAAFEHRIKRLVIWGVIYEFVVVVKSLVGEAGYEFLMGLSDTNARDDYNKLSYQRAKEDSCSHIIMQRGLYVSGVKDPFDSFNWMRKLSIKGIAHLIEQDTLIMHGIKDHAIPLDHFNRVIAELSNAHSITARIFTEFEHGAEHCQIGNPALAVDEIERWMNGLDRRNDNILNSKR